jgi:alpha-methylacyl-CoA racemase
MEKIGLGPQNIHSINRKTVYIRLTGWGQKGEMKNDAGHDINYLALSGVLSLLGKEGSPPEAPINLVADYGSGTMFAVISGLLGLYEVKNNKKENIVYDVAMFEGASYLASLMFGLNDLEMWNKERGSNLLDGGAPFYKCYETIDNKYVAVGALENKFFKELITKLNLPEEMVNEQMDLNKWPEHESIFSEIFLSKSRDEWAIIFKNSDSCVTPVLNLEEARKHPHSISRGSFLNNFPRSDNMLKEKTNKVKKNSIESILEELNVSKDFIKEVEKNGTLLIE